LNERLINQQGIFLVQGDIEKSFDENLRESVRDSKKLFRMAFVVEPEERKAILKELYKMNITNATLFPDLQGFAESLVTQLAYPDKFGSVVSTQLQRHARRSVRIPGP
jgi:hypothetical protein